MKLFLMSILPSIFTMSSGSDRCPALSYTHGKMVKEYESALFKEDDSDESIASQLRSKEKPSHESIEAKMKLIEQVLSKTRQNCSTLKACDSIPEWLVDAERKENYANQIASSSPIDDIVSNVILTEKYFASKKLPLGIYLRVHRLSPYDEIRRSATAGITVKMQWKFSWPLCKPYYIAVLAKNIDSELHQLGYGSRNFTLDELASISESLKTQRPPLAKLSFGSSRYDSFWLPNIKFDNVSSISWILPFNTDQLLMQVKLNSTVECHFTRQYSVNMVISCIEDFAKYPVDKQKCGSAITSYDNWLNITVKSINSDVKALHDQKIEFRCRENTFRVSYKRIFVTCLYRVYIPFFSVVFINFVTFWLAIHEIDIRLNIQMSCFIALLFQFLVTRELLPDLNFLTYIDHFMLLSISTVTVTIMQSTILYIYLHHSYGVAEEKAEREKRRKGKRARQIKALPLDDSKASKVLKMLKGGKPKKRDEAQKKRVTIPRPLVTLGQVFAEKMTALNELLFEPPVKKDAPEYGPMKFDLLCRFILPSIFIICLLVHFQMLQMAFVSAD